MRNLRDTLSDVLLPRVGHPGQYINGEINARCGDVHAAEVTVALAFPDTYSIGISHLGSQVLYHMANGMDGVACDRTYCPAPDAEAVMREHAIPLFGWESRSAVADFDLLGFSLPYELCVSNVLTMLDLAGVPLRANDRGPGDPIVIAGDALADSPEPMAEFIDLFIIGDGERPLAELIELVRAAKRQGRRRDQIILEAAKQIDGAYAPAYYRPDYERGGTVAPILGDVPICVRRAHLASLAESPIPTRPLVPLAEAVHDRVVIEIMRGCPNGCRFCQAGATRLPVRIRPVDDIIRAARAAIASTGADEISLLSLSTSDYPWLDELIERLNAEFASRHVSISLPSLRVGEQLRHLPRLTSLVRKGGLTIAAEAGSDRLRRAIGKGIAKAGEAPAVNIAAFVLETPHELALAKHLLHLGEILDLVSRELKPHHLCTYLYELATRFSGFYENCPVLSSEGALRTSRLGLCTGTVRTMELGLGLLGIAIPEQM